MTLEQTIGFAAALAVMLIGLVGCLLPAIPGTPLVLAAAVAHWLYFDAASVSTFVLILLVLLTVLSMVLDHLATMFGARRLGATWRGVVGAGLGAFIGLFFSLPGILFGPFIGAITLELMGGREFKDAARAGAGAMLGLMIGAVGKVGCSVAIIALFVVSVLDRSSVELELERTAGRGAVSLSIDSQLQ